MPKKETTVEQLQPGHPSYKDGRGTDQYIITESSERTVFVESVAQLDERINAIEYNRQRFNTKFDAQRDRLIRLRTDLLTAQGTE